MVKVSELVSRPHEILDSVTVESFAKDCEVCIVTHVILKTAAGNMQRERLQQVVNNQAFNQSIATEKKMSEAEAKQKNIELYTKLAETEQELDGMGIQKERDALEFTHVNDLVRKLLS